MKLLTTTCQENDLRLPYMLMIDGGGFKQVDRPVAWGHVAAISQIIPYLKILCASLVTVAELFDEPSYCYLDVAKVC